MTYFDSTLQMDPIKEQQYDPAIPEDRHVFELIGFERSQPDQWRKDGGIKWTWLVYEQDGRTPFIFNDEHYQFFRTTGIDKQGKPVFSVGTYANDWASALLGRPLDVDSHFDISELRGKKMSAMVVWEKQRTDPNKKTIKLASLRHVPTGATATTAPQSRAQVEADATVDDVDRALAVSKFEKKLERAKKKKLPNLQLFVSAYEVINTATEQEVNVLIDNIDDALDAMDD